MGTFVNRAAAAKMLDVSPRTIYRLVDRGLLRPARQGREAGVLEEDVVQLQGVRAATEPELPSPLSKSTITMLLARVRDLEHRMQVVLKMLGLNRDPLGLTDLELANIYRAAEGCAEKGWAPHSEPTWVDVLVRIRYEDLLRIADLLQVEKPWLPLLRLTATMRLAAYDKTLGPTLNEAYDNIYNLAFVWGQSHGDTAKTTEMVAKKDARPRGVLLRQLRRAQEQDGGSPPPEPQGSSDPPA